MLEAREREPGQVVGIYVDGWMLHAGDLSHRQLHVGDRARLALRCTPVREHRPRPDHRVQPILRKRGEWNESLVDVGFPATSRTPKDSVEIGSVIPGDFWLMPMIDTDVADLAHPTSTLQEYAPLMVQTWLIEAIEEQYAAYGRRGVWTPVVKTRDRAEVEQYAYWVQALLIWSHDGQILPQHQEETI